MKTFNFDGHKLIHHLDRVQEFMTRGDCFPLYLEISPVGSCNHRCIFCAYDFIGYPNRKLETARTLTLLDELAEAGLKSILFAGEGEPLLHPDLGRLVRHAAGNGIDVGLFTNGQLLSEELAAEMLPHLTFLRLSFNGGSAENYAQIHQVKAQVFDTVLANIAAACRFKRERGLSVDVGAQFVLIPENCDYLCGAGEALKGAGLDYLVIKPFVQQSCQQGYQAAEMLSLERVEPLLKQAEALSDRDFTVLARRKAFEAYGRRSYRHCYGSSFISALNSAGDLATCLPYWDQEDFVFGNIYQNSFREIWDGAKRAKLLQQLQHCLDTGNCPPNCRANEVNDFLWGLKHPSVKHINFI
jgi:MoaA/NifB/PqqE/SkfB family radical SAM enzyme